MYIILKTATIFMFFSISNVTEMKSNRVYLCKTDYSVNFSYLGISLLLFILK